MQNSMKRIVLSLISILLLSTSVMGAKRMHQTQYYNDWVVRLAESQMQHDPLLWMADGVKQPKWDYTQGLMAKAMLQAYQLTNTTKYLDYVQEFADYFIDNEGNIRTYKMADYNIDRVNGGTFLYTMNDIHPEERYQKAIDRLFMQLKGQPRVKEGGFWHKKIYTHQMWLDGIYMGEPFYARYASEHELKPEEVHAGDYQGTVGFGFDDILLQFEVVDRHTYDPKTGLNYHGWDESREQQWANKETGCSPNFWGRAMGWYMMAMVDVLDYMPQDHPGYKKILAMLKRSAKNIQKYQDPKTHLWYQVLDKPGEEGNYQETTCSAMFCYVFAKAANRGYLPKKYFIEAERIFDGIVSEKLKKDEKGYWNLVDCCSVAGLGGKPYRSGTYEYYINERIGSNDPKGVGPLMFAALELGKGRF